MDNKTSLRYWLALNRVPGVGTITFNKLIGYFGDPEFVFQQGKQSLCKLGIKEKVADEIEKFDWKLIDDEIDWLATQCNFHVITLSDHTYPNLLKEIPDPPPVLYVRGSLAALAVQPQLAIVGSRTPTPTGIELARDLASQLAAKGIVITSGLALGIDGASHQGALSVAGTTLAVVGCGLDRVYPGRHKKLAEEIVKIGAVVSEFPSGTPPAPANFPRRNRIISGLSKGVLVIEAALRSGSLITARYALEQGREVFAIPGSPRNMKAEGCNSLLKQGACLVTAVDDITVEIGFKTTKSSPLRQPESAGISCDIDGETRLVLSKIDAEPVSVDRVVERCGLTAEKVSSILMVLELHGLVQSTAGGSVCRIA